MELPVATENPNQLAWHGISDTLLVALYLYSQCVLNL